MPVYAFPREDVALAAPFTFQARGFADPDLDGYLTIPWDCPDHWFEEDEEVFVHPRDPIVRVDAPPSSRHVRVERDGRLLADSESAILVFETGLPTRYYLLERDVDASLLADSDLQTGCPYKGVASYRDVLLNGHRHRGLFWSYQMPFRETMPRWRRGLAWAGGDVPAAPTAGDRLRRRRNHRRAEGRDDTGRRRGGGYRGDPGRDHEEILEVLAVHLPWPVISEDVEQVAVVGDLAPVGVVDHGELAAQPGAHRRGRRQRRGKPASSLGPSRAASVTASDPGRVVGMLVRTAFDPAVCG